MDSKPKHGAAGLQGARTLHHFPTVDFGADECYERTEPPHPRDDESFSVFRELRDPELSTYLAAMVHPDGLAGLNTYVLPPETLHEAVAAVSRTVSAYISESLDLIWTHTDEVEIDLNLLAAESPTQGDPKVSNAMVVEGGKVILAFEDRGNNRQLFRDLRSGKLFVKAADERASAYRIGETVFPLQPARAYATLLEIVNLSANELLSMLANHNGNKRKRA
jgi:hypothetical protein